MKISYIPEGVCSYQIDIEIEDNIIKNVEFFGGCPGNALGLVTLIKGMKVEDVIERLQDVKCGRKATSCPAQLALALKQIKEE